jgi:hypothetical protein
MPELAAPGPTLADWPAARRRGWLALIVVVALGHLVTVDWLVEDRFGWGQGERAPPRIEVAFVRELAQAPAPVATPPPPAAHAARRARPVPAPASAPEAAASAAALELAATASTDPAHAPTPGVEAPPPAQQQVQAPPEPPPQPPAPVNEPTTPPVATPAAAAASAVPSFDWPPSTRMSYALVGHYRGPLEGRAQVDWLRSGTRYQVHLETSLGPVLSRHITSEGELTDRGLAPRRFDGEQKVLLRAPRRWTQQFGPERIVLAGGEEVDTQPGVQDEASQFVQLTWLFTTQPQLLQVGRSVEVPLALNRRVDRWIFEVVGEETLRLPFGEVPSFHVKPRREVRSRDTVAEIWFAPTLQYLPVRILIRQEDNWIDLTLEKPPLQAAR